MTGAFPFPFLVFPRGSAGGLGSPSSAGATGELHGAAPCPAAAELLLFLGLNFHSYEKECFCLLIKRQKVCVTSI